MISQVIEGDKNLGYVGDISNFVRIDFLQIHAGYV